MTTTAACPDPSFHGNPFKACPWCGWGEAPEPDPGSAMVRAIRAQLKHAQYGMRVNRIDQAAMEIAKVILAVATHNRKTEEAVDTSEWPEFIIVRKSNLRVRKVNHEVVEWDASFCSEDAIPVPDDIAAVWERRALDGTDIWFGFEGA